MMDIREILCPIDYSDASRHALEHALAVAKWFGARITALHVVHSPLFPPSTVLFAGLPDPSSSEITVDRACEQVLRDWVATARSAGVSVAVDVREGNVAREILAIADARATDLIAMGTHGRGGFDRFVLGSVTEKILRRARCPVLTVPPNASTRARLPYVRILCAIDFSEPSLHGFRYALSLAQEADAKLTLLHVVEWPIDEHPIPARLRAADVLNEMTADARQRLAALVPKDAAVWCKPSTTVACGKPYERILDIAANDESDLIVIGVHGRNALDVALFGSTTNHVVRSAPCPVLTVNRREAGVGCGR